MGILIMVLYYNTLTRFFHAAENVQPNGQPPLTFNPDKTAHAVWMMVSFDLDVYPLLMALYISMWMTTSLLRASLRIYTQIANISPTLQIVVTHVGHHLNFAHLMMPPLGSIIAMYLPPPPPGIPHVLLSQRENQESSSPPPDLIYPNNQT